jgi:carbamate kinase
MDTARERSGEIVVAALGGNALLRRGERPELDLQRRRIAEAAPALAAVAATHRLVLTHGNGPQVGLLALQGSASTEVAAYPLDALDAETEGMIGYLLQQALRNAAPGLEVATLLTQVIVDADDPAFRRPTKPIGAVYADRASAEAAGRGDWSVAADGRGFRRVVASPNPRRVVELAVVRHLVDAGVVVIAVGGGGIPVMEDADGRLHGVEAVIDKDLATALLATGLGARRMLLLTDVDAVHDDYGGRNDRAVRCSSPAALRAMTLPSGSMGPKVEAACRFAELNAYRDAEAVIGSLDDLPALLEGSSGTRVAQRFTSLEWWESPPGAGW